DDMIRLAADDGITVFLDPADTGGWYRDIRTNGPAKDFTYGVYVGNRYKNFPNVVWLNGNDFQTWSSSPTDDADVTAIAKGIESVATNHVQTVELNYNRSSSLDDPNWRAIVGLNFAYTYYPTYDEVLRAYNHTPAVPAFMGEANYESENNAGTGPGRPYPL